MLDITLMYPCLYSCKFSLSRHFHCWGAPSFMVHAFNFRSWIYGHIEHHEYFLLCYLLTNSSFTFSFRATVHVELFMIYNLCLGFFFCRLIDWHHLLNCCFSMLLLLLCQRPSEYGYSVCSWILYSLTLTYLSFNRCHLVSIPVAHLQAFK